MSLLAQQVALLTNATRPPIPSIGRVHRIEDDEEETTVIECPKTRKREADRRYREKHKLTKQK